MFSRICAYAAAMTLCFTLSAFSRTKPAPKFVPISKPEFQSLKFGEMNFAAAVQCSSWSVDSLAWRMDGWVSGNELYKAYIDPAHQCANPYPYKVFAVSMPMYFAKATSVTVSVDIELPNTSNPSCPTPGNALAISSNATLSTSAAGYYSLWVPLDSPITVNGPFFAGFFIASTVDTSAGAGILLDADPQHCQSYNIWDTTIGFVDLTNFPLPFPSTWDFPGRLAMEVAGEPGGSAGTECCQVVPSTTTDFGTVLFPQTKDLSFTVTNCGTAVLNATAAENCPAFTLPSGGGSFSVSPGGSHTVTVRFIPTTPGSYSCTVSLGNAACSTLTFTGIGGSTDPAPQTAWIMPMANSTQLGKTTLWVRDTSGSGSIDYAVFEYSNGGAFTEIGRDYDGSSPIRDGVNSAQAGNGFSYDWNFSGLTRGDYTLRATLYDAQNRSSAVTLPVHLEPNPPIPAITSPLNGSDFCSPFNVFMQCSDQTMQSVQVFRHNALAAYSNGIGTLNQQLLGDVNGNAFDGNYAYNGEFGDFYSGPAAAALVVKSWSDRGFSGIMKSGGSAMTLTATAESLAVAFNTRAKKGTSDEQMFAGLLKYSAARGDTFTFDFARNPDYWTIRTWVEDEQRGVVLGLSGNPGFWVAVTGFNGWKLQDGNYMITVSDPISGTASDCEFNFTGMTGSLYIENSWHPVDIMISMTPKNWTVTRQAVGTDPSGADGWAVQYTPTGLTEGGLYFFRSVGQNSGGYYGSSAVLTRYTCATNYAVGDMNGDNIVDLADLTVLIQFITAHRNPPVGGAWRADCNCDNVVNIADIIYYCNFLFGTGSQPCH